MSLGLLGHERLLGKSAMANGAEKYDYLCRAKLRLAGAEIPLVVKVAPDQPNLLGLDAMVLLDMEIHPASQKYSIASRPVIKDPSAAQVPFRWLRFEAILNRFQLTDKDLVPLPQLPLPVDSYSALISAGSQAIDLGTASSSPWVMMNVPKQVPVINLGWSC